MDLNIQNSIAKLSSCMFDKTSQLSSQSNNPTEDELKFLERVHSYSPTDWYDRPLWLSPVRCSIFGWISIGSGILQCQSCGNKIGGHIDKNLDITAERLTFERLENLLINGHNTWCIWKSCSIPERFLRVDIQKEVQHNFLERFISLNSLINVPLISKEFYLDLNKERFEIVLNLLDDTYRKKLCNEQKLFSLISIALCGWTLCETNQQLLICKFCRRSLGLWNYIMLLEINSNEEINFGNKEDIMCLESQMNTPNSSNLKNENSNKITLDASVENLLENNNENCSYDYCKEVNNCCDDKIIVNNIDDIDNCHSDNNGDIDLMSIPFKFAVNKLKRNLDVLNDKLQQEYKKMKIQPIKKNTLHPINEHQPWCIWVGDEIKTSHSQSINLENTITNYLDSKKLNSNYNHISQSTDIHLNDTFYISKSTDIYNEKSLKDPPYVQLMRKMFYPVTLSNLKNEERIEEVHRVKNLLKL